MRCGPSIFSMGSPPWASSLSLFWFQAILSAMTYTALYFPALLSPCLIACNMFVSSPFPTTVTYMFPCSSLHVKMQPFLKGPDQMPSLLLKTCLILQSRKTFPSFTFLMFFFFFLNFMYFCLRWVFVAARRLSLVAASRGYSSLWCAGFSLRQLPLLRSTGSRRAGFSSCGSRAPERGLSSCGAWA